MILLIEDHESNADKQTNMDLYLVAYRFPRTFGTCTILQGGCQPCVASQFQAEY